MNVRHLFLSSLCASAVIGCGEPTYDIPPVDEAESKKQSEEIEKKMHDEMMKQQGQANPG